MDKKKVFSSSTGQGGSMMWTGVISAVLTSLVGVASLFGLPDLINAEEISLVAVNMGTVVSSVAIIYGLARKVVNKLAK